MAEEVIGLLFGVEGGGSIDGASGKQIVNDLTSIVKAINDGKSSVPKIKFHFDTTEATQAVNDLKKKLKDIEKVASIKVTYSNGGQGGRGTGMAQGLQSEMQKFIALQKKISATKTTIGKLELNNGDVQLVAAYRKELERLETQYAKTMGSFVDGISASADNIMLDDILDFDDRIANLQDLEGAQIAAEQTTQRYRELVDVVSQWSKETKTAAKLAAEYGNVTRELDGYLSDAAPGYEETTARINKTVDALRQLQVEFSLDENDILKISKPENLQEVLNQLGITEQQYDQLFDQIVKGSKLAAEAVESANRKNEQSWTATASKIRDEVQRMYLVISKDPKARKMAQEIIAYSQSATGSVGDLKNKYDELRDVIHASGADVETWGDKFKKSIGNNLRTALASAAMGAATKYLHDIYQNVVEIDKATVDLQIATGKSRDEVKELAKDYSRLAQTLGATTTEIMQAADTWLRQGYEAAEANTLITNSTMLAKLGQMEATEATTALTSAMKGYNVSVSDSVSIVDKFTAVDMEAAASAGDIATAMAETAASAKSAGVSMDTLIGYIATVKEVTQDGAESVGTFYRTLFARMNNIKVGKFVDDETGEELNDVERVLNELGIALRDTNEQFRASDEVLNEVGRRWNEFNDVEQRAIATAFAGTRQQEKFMVLMQNFGTAMEYANVATESAGTSMEKFNAYTEGIEGKMNALKAAFEEFSITLLNSDLIAGAVDFASFLMQGLTHVGTFIDAIGGLPTVLLAVATALLAVNGGLIAYNVQQKAVTAYGIIIDFFKKLRNGLADVATAIPNATAAWKAYAAGTVSANTAMQASIPVIGLVLAAVTALVGAISLANRASEESAQKSREAADAASTLSEEVTELTYKYLDLNDAVRDDQSAKESLLQTQDELINKLKLEKYEVDELIEKYGSYEEALKQASLEQLREDERNLRGGLLTSQKSLLNEAREKTFKSSFMDISSYTSGEVDESNYHAHAALKALSDAGYAPAYTSYADASGNKYSDLFSISNRDKYNDLQTPKDIINAYNDLGKMLDIVGNETGDQNFVYEALYAQYRDMKEYVDAYTTSVDDLNRNLAEQYTINALIGRELPQTKEEFEVYRQKVISAAVTNGEFAGSESDVTSAIDSVLSRQSAFSQFYTDIEEGNKQITQTTEEYREALEKEQEMYERQLDNFDQLVKLRKDLLKTYKEELDYQKELEKRQRSVADLQTKLAVARLDNSATGQARVRELEAELADAQEELDDFTLEHAIDVLIDQLDNTNNEWKDIVQSKLNDIASLLEDLNKTSGALIDSGAIGGTDADHTSTSALITREQFDAGHRSGDRFRSYEEYLRYYNSKGIYHQGGFVGDVITLSSNEEFAKLLQGEFVSTPAQMKRFMEDTLPSIVGYTATNGINEFNAPLIEITCESVTSESMPELKRIVNEAVNEIKRELDSGMSRTGFKRQTTKRLI